MIGIAIGVLFTSSCGFGPARLVLFPRVSLVIGDLRRGQLDGRGSQFNIDGTYLTGDWKMGKLEGLGEAKYRDGSVYVGKFEYGLKHGKGEVRFPNGSAYTGTWIRDKLQDKVGL